MKRSLRLISFFLFCLSSWASCSAAMPESGWWWNAAEGGRGYSIEIQDNQLYFASYTYDSNRQPIWYYSFGTLTGDSAYSGRVLRVTDGPCFGCAQGNPISVDVGAISIQFSGNNANLNILGVNTKIKRFDFTSQSDNSIAPNACYGEWAGVIGTTAYPVYFGERLVYNNPYSSGGTNYLSGYRSGSSANASLCSFDAASGSWSIILDSSTSYWQFIRFQFTGFNRMEGTTWTYLKGASPTGAGLPWIAFRTSAKSYVQGRGGPSVSKMDAGTKTDSGLQQLRLIQDKYLVEGSGTLNLAPTGVISAATGLELVLKNVPAMPKNIKQP